MNKYDVLNDIQKDLIKQNIVDLPGEVDYGMIAYVREALIRLRAMGSPAIEVRISSGGGKVCFGLNIYDELRNYSGQKIGIVSGLAMSMAAIILQACDRRKCLRHSDVRIHHVIGNGISLDVFDNDKKLQAKIREFKDQQKKLYQILIERTGKTEEVIKRVCAKDKNMTAEEALKFGLIDEII